MPTREHSIRCIQLSERAKGAVKASCGETVAQKRAFGKSVSSLPLEGFQDLSGVLRANLKGAEKKRTLQTHPFGQSFLRRTPSPLLWRTLKLASFFVGDVILANSELTAISLATPRSWERDQKWKFPKSGQERVQKVFWTQGAKVFLHWCKKGLHRCITGFGWCKRLLGDLCSLGPKHLLHPLLTTFGKFPFSGPLPGPWGRNISRLKARI